MKYHEKLQNMTDKQVKRHVEAWCFVGYIVYIMLFLGLYYLFHR